jgi:hypothetical protein
MKVVYVAGRFRADSHWGIVKNVRAAEALALEVWRLGAAALTPHMNTANFQGALPDQVWTDGTLALLEKCDAVVLVPGWEDSQGTRGEVRRAIDLGIPVFYELFGLESWLRGLEVTDKVQAAT